MAEFMIPEGHIVVPRGGRPPKVARDVAVSLAKMTRTSHHGELVKQADPWILGKWKDSVGISDESTIRRAVSNAASHLNASFIAINGTMAAAFKAPIRDGSTGWIWAEGMIEAQAVTVRNVSAQITADMVKMKPTSLATRQLFAR
jgi:hypothetical protein